MTSTAAQLEHLKLDTEFIDIERCKHTIARPGEPVTYETWTRTKQIGEGGFGVVYRETCSERSTEVRAVKQIRKSSLRWAEVGILAQLRSNPEHFVQITGWFEDKYHIYLAMEYLPGDLGGLLKGSARGLREDESKGVSKQILAGLAILHEMCICHRDLKPGNILISNWVPLRVKIGDFGVSKHCDGNTEWRTTTGTRPFMAPEIQDLSGEGTSVYTTAVDIWSMGCLVYFMITKTPPFPEPRNLSHFLRDQSLFPPRTAAAQTIPDSAVGFIASLLQPLPENRPPASRALMHSWLLIQDQDETLWPTIHTQPDAGEPAPAPRPQQSAQAAKGSALAMKGKWATEGKLDQIKQHRVRIDVLQHLLVAAAASGNCELLVQQLGKGAAPMEDPSGYTPMYVAAKNGHLSIIQLLLEHGAHLGVGGTLGVSALHGAAIGGNLQIVQYLLEKGANVSERGEVKSHGWTALLLAAWNGQLEIVVCLLDGGADISAKKLDDGFDSLHLATQAGHYKVVKLLLDRGADITAVERQGLTAFHVAARDGRTEVLQLLVEQGADIPARCASSDRWTALMYAVWSGHLSAVSYLLDKGADVTAVDEQGRMAHHLSALDGSTDVLQLLVERGADISAHTTSSGRWTALLYAAWKGHLNAARYLLDRGADITAAEQEGLMALHVAARYGNTLVLQLLVERGADISARSVSADQWTALMYAVWSGHLSAVRYLLDNGADITAVEGKEQRRMAHHIAAIKGKTEVLQLLVERGADISAHTTSAGRWTALLYAAWKGHLNAARYLLDRGADITAVEKDGLMALHVAARYGATEVLQLLVERGADISAQSVSSDPWTALMYAVWSGHLSAVRYLLDKGADITAVDGNGRMAHHNAAIAGKTEVLQLLVERGADISAHTTSSGRWTALLYAAWKGHLNAARYLLDRGADITAAEEEGLMALHVAARYGATEVLQLLVERGADISARSVSSDPWTALMHAVWSGHLSAVRYLLDNGADITAVDGNGRMAHHNAALNGQTEVLQLLVERGADISAHTASSGRWTALLYAAWKGHSNAARYLLDRGADITAVEGEGRMAHHLAAKFGATEVLQLLVERGADISALAGNGFTALMYAAFHGRLDAVRYLLEIGASPSVTTGGQTAISLAANKGHTEIAVLLGEWYERDTSITLTELDNLKLSTGDSTQTTNEEYESMTLWDSTT